MLGSTMVGVLALAACGSATVTASDGDESAASLDGTAWILIEGIDMTPGTELTLSFDGENVSGSDGCNGFGGSGSFGDGSFEFGDEISQTAIGCEEPTMAAAADYMQALFESDRWQVEGGQLTLTGAPVPLVFVSPPEVDDAELTGVTWLLSTIIEGDTASTPLGTSGFLRLEEDGTLTGSTGCRDLEGQWILGEGNRVVFPSFSAEGACVPELVGQDGFVVTVLGDGFRAEPDGDRLLVTSPGVGGLEFTASDGAAPETPIGDRIGFEFDPDAVWQATDDPPAGFVEVFAEAGGGELVGELGPGERLVAVGLESVEVNGERWRQVQTDALLTAWVLDEFLVELG